MLALVMYSFNMPGQVQLYKELNKFLVQRNHDKAHMWHPFVHHLLTALEKLPPVKTTVYRSVLTFKLVKLRSNRCGQKKRVNSIH